MRWEETSCEIFITFIGTCVKISSKRTSKSVGRSRIFYIFYTNSVELVMCDSDFPVRNCSICVRKRDKLYNMSGSVWR